MGSTKNRLIAMKKIKIENYVCYADKTVKFDELSDDDKEDMRKKMLQLLEKDTNVNVTKGK